MLDRTRVGNELVLDLFHRDAVAFLAKHRVMDPASFAWQSYVKVAGAHRESEGEGGGSPEGGRRRPMRRES